MRLPVRFSRKNLLLVCLLLSYIFSFSLLPSIHVDLVAASPEVTVSILPSVVVANPGESFTVDIDITDVEDLYSWGIKISWEPELLEAISVTEGPFLRGPGGTGFAKTIKHASIDCGCTILGTYPGASGNGTLMTVTFNVTDRGKTALEIYDSKLLDSATPAVEIPHTAEDGYFYTTLPAASFTWSPYSTPMNWTHDSYGRPLVGETVTFDASASYDPDGGSIVSYEWDFGDNATGTGMIVTHVYDMVGDYNVRLDVTDDDGETDSQILDPDDIFNPPIAIQIHDVAVVGVSYNVTNAIANETVEIYVTVMNNGSHPTNPDVQLSESLNVTLYYVDYTYRDHTWHSISTYKKHVSAQPGRQVTIGVAGKYPDPFYWNTTGVAPDSYAVWAYAYLVDPDDAFVPGLEENTANNGRFGDRVNVAAEVEHDIAVTDVTVTPTEAEVGETVKINVQVKNEGNVEETFSVSAYNGSSLVKTQNATLVAGTEETLPLSWFSVKNTTAPTAYNISVQVPPVTNETDTADNTLANVTGTIQLLPVANFSFSPTEPVLNQTVTFDASASYAPGTPPKTIVSHSWDFGDGTSDTGVTATHAYDMAGEFYVTLTVLDSDGLRNMLTRSLIVPKFNSTITCSVSATPVPVGSPETAITGAISPVRTGANVSIQYKRDGEVTWTHLANVTTDGNGQYSYDWTPWLTPETYEIRASWPGDDVTLPAESSPIAVDVVYAPQEITRTISLSTSATKITSGERVTINGSITSTQVAETVTIWHRVFGETWDTLAVVITDEDSQYSYDWTPRAAGTYEVKASWQGNATAEADESEVQVIVVQEGPTLNVFLYSTVTFAAIWIATLIFFGARKRKPWH